VSGKRQSELLQAHGTIMATVFRIERAKAPGEARSAVLDLARILPGHLAEEERADGLFAWLTVLAPERAEEVERLAKDHDELRRHLAAAKQCGPGELAECARVLVSSIREHEQRESALIRGVLEED
jgi:bacterioferritin-associated ferredoxin